MALRVTNGFDSLAGRFRYRRHDLMHLWPAHSPLHSGMIGRADSALHLCAHRLAPFLGAEVELIGQLVPEAILAADLRQNEIAVEGVRGFLVRTKQAIDRFDIQPVGCDLETRSGAIARPAILLGARAQIRAHGVEDDIPENVRKVRFPIDEKRFEPSLKQMATKAVVS